MECVVTGAAGFIGSHLCEKLLREGHQVLGIDCFTDYYAREIKEQNLRGLRSHPWFRFHEVDLRTDPLVPLLQGTECVFHLAAMAGLLRSWIGFDDYVSCNLTATQRLLEACREAPLLNRFLYASTSSVYGKFATGDESLPLRPTSPYGVTKLAGENLCRVYCEQFHLPVVVLRYFSVFGPRQRPDMGYHKFIRAILRDEVIELTGDGSHVRGNTYITDCINATVAATATVVGETFNVGGGETVGVMDVIRKIEKITGKSARIRHVAERPGDQKYTGADIGKLTLHTGWKPTIGVDEGLEQQVRWQMTEINALRRAA